MAFDSVWGSLLCSFLCFVYIFFFCYTAFDVSDQSLFLLLQGARHERGRDSGNWKLYLH